MKAIPSLPRLWLTHKSARISKKAFQLQTTRQIIDLLELYFFLPYKEGSERTKLDVTMVFKMLCCLPFIQASLF